MTSSVPGAVEQVLKQLDEERADSSTEAPLERRAMPALPVPSAKSRRRK